MVPLEKAFGTMLLSYGVVGRIANVNSMCNGVCFWECASIILVGPSTSTVKQQPVGGIMTVNRGGKCTSVDGRDLVL